MAKTVDLFKRVLSNETRIMNSAENINWVRLWWIVGIVLAGWTGLVTILPPHMFKIVAALLAALQSGFLFAARGSKYVKDRTELPPSDGKP